MPSIDNRKIDANQCKKRRPASTIRTNVDPQRRFASSAGTEVDERFAMGRAIAIRTDFNSRELRRLAKQTKDVAQSRRLLAIAAVLDGASRQEAAKAGGMDRQTLRDWVIRFNRSGPAGLTNIPSPGARPKLNHAHIATLVRIAGNGPISAENGMARGHVRNMIEQLHVEFGLKVSDDTVYRALKKLGLARPRSRRRPRLSVAPEQHLPAGSNPGDEADSQ